MTELDFTIEFNSPLENENEYDLFVVAEGRLREVAEGHDDLVGAAINLRELDKGSVNPLMEATVVVYGRPDHLSATSKERDPAAALNEALDAVERQIRKRREKLKKSWERPGNDPISQEVMEVLAAEAAIEEEVSEDFDEETGVDTKS